MFCPHCNKEIKDNATVCIYCGESVLGPSEAAIKYGTPVRILSLITLIASLASFVTLFLGWFVTYLDLKGNVLTAAQSFNPIGIQYALKFDFLTAGTPAYWLTILIDDLSLFCVAFYVVYLALFLTGKKLEKFWGLVATASHLAISICSVALPGMVASQIGAGYFTTSPIAYVSLVLAILSFVCLVAMLVLNHSVGFHASAFFRKKTIE